MYKTMTVISSIGCSALTHETLQPVGATVLEEEVNEHNRDEHDNGIEVVEEEGEVAVERPGNDNEERDHTSRNLDTRADSNADGEFHLALASHPNRRDVLGGVTNKREKDDTDEAGEGQLEAKRADVTKRLTEEGGATARQSRQCCPQECRRRMR